MAENDKIRYSDIIQPDDSIEKLVKQLSELNQSYETTVNAIRAGADRIVHALKSASGATSEGRKRIDEAVSSATRLERAQNELKLAMSDTGRQIAILKAQTSNYNKSTVEHYRYIQQAVSSYDRLKSDLKESVSLFKSLTEAEREDSQMGQQLLQDILNLKNQISALDAAMKPHIQVLTEVEKAEQKLVFLQSEEGQKLLDLKARISELTNARKQHKAVIDPLAQAEEKLAYARSEENQQLKLYSTQIKEANRIAQLQATIAASEEGSYNRLSAQYELNKIKLNQMSTAKREAVDVGKKLEAETRAIYQQMIKMQEATGNYKLSVGHYQRTWDGLGISISQVVRELPAAAVSLNTFFLGISNNIPMLVDEINKLRKQNKLFQAEGKATINITKSITKALFGWNTILVILLTVLSMFGSEIIAWIGGLIKGKDAVLSLGEALENISKELENTNADYGVNIVSLRRLSDQWKELKTTAEKTKWIKDNESEFKNLKLSIDSIKDAETAFEKNTRLIEEAFKRRAYATASYKLASQEYEKALLEEMKIETLKNAEITTWDKVKAMYRQIISNTTGMVDIENKTATERAEFKRKKDIKEAEENVKKYEGYAEKYYKIGKKFDDQMKKLLKQLGIFYSDGPDKNKGRDVTDYLNRMSLSVQKKYEESLTRLEKEENKRRRKEAIANYNTRVAELMNTYDKNKRILANEKKDYRELTDYQKQQIKDAQETILKTVESYQKELTEELQEIEKDRQISELKILKETLNKRLEYIKKGSLQELQLRLQIIEAERRIALLENSKLPTSQQQKQDIINAGFASQSRGLVVDYSNTYFEQYQAAEKAKFNAVKHSEKNITLFTLNQEKERWTRQINLAKIGAVDWSEEQIKAAEYTVKGIDREIGDLKNVFKGIGKNGIGTTILESLDFDKDSIDAVKNATNIIIENLQAIAQAEIELAQAGVDASKERVEAAKNAYDSEIEARNNGYANNVATAKKELEQEKKNQLEKIKLLEEAQRRQEAINTVVQASSLITASANLWSSLSIIPVVGPVLAIGAIAAMWSSFATAKVKAKQVTAAQSEEYGEGGLEFLHGGSHASGNDINLGVKNKDNKVMKVEGGEALAIINKNKTARYKKMLPDIVDSLNKGTFENKYLNAFSESSNRLTAMTFNSNSVDMDLSKIEADIQSIRKQNEIKYYIMPNGTIITQYKNVKRIIRK